MASSASATDIQAFERIVDKAAVGEGMRNALMGMANVFGRVEPKPTVLAFKKMAAFLERISAHAGDDIYLGTSSDGGIRLEFDVQPPFEVGFLPDGKANTLNRKSIRPSRIYVPARVRAHSQPGGRS